MRVRTAEVQAIHLHQVPVIMIAVVVVVLARKQLHQQARVIRVPETVLRYPSKLAKLHLLLPQLILRIEA